MSPISSLSLRAQAYYGTINRFDQFAILNNSDAVLRRRTTIKLSRISYFKNWWEPTVVHVLSVFLLAGATKSN